MSRGKRATVGDEGGPPTPSQSSADGCPKCGYSQFDALHSEPGELERRQCKSCGEVYGVKPADREISVFDGQEQEETMAKEKTAGKFKCDICGRDDFKTDQGMKHHKTTTHGKGKEKPVGIRRAGLAGGPLSTPSPRQQILADLGKRKAQALAAVAELDDLIDAIEKAGR